MLLPLFLVACSNFGNKDGRPSGSMVKQQQKIASIPDAVPKVEPLSKYGNPATYTVFGRSYSVLKSRAGYRKKGVASWYGTKFHGRRTSSGEPYDMYAMTAAHKTLPLPSYVQVTNLENQRRVVVKVNDRGPFHEDRIIDLSYAAATKLGIAGNGTGLVEVKVLEAENKHKRLVNGSTDRKIDKQTGVDLFVQIGAFVDRGNAQGVEEKLKDSAIDNVRVSRVDLPLRSVYRVRVGPMPSVEHADKMSDKLAKLGFIKTSIVVE